MFQKGECITTQDFASLRVFKKRVVLRRKILRRCVFKTGCGVLRWCKILHRCVCSKGLVYYDARFCVAFQKGCVLRRKILRRCVCSKGLVYYDARFCACCFIKWSVAPCILLFSTIWWRLFHLRWPAPTAKRWVLFGKGYDWTESIFCSCHWEQVFIGSKDQNQRQQTELTIASMFGFYTTYHLLHFAVVGITGFEAFNKHLVCSVGMESKTLTWKSMVSDVCGHAQFDWFL